MHFLCEIFFIILVSYLNSLFTCMFCLLSLYESYIIRHICAILIVYNYQSTFLMLSFILFYKILKLFYTYWFIFFSFQILCISNSCISHKASLFMGFSRQEYWSGLPFPTPGDLPDSGIEFVSLMSLALTGRFFTTGTTWEALMFSCRPHIVILCLAFLKQYSNKSFWGVS